MNIAMNISMLYTITFPGIIHIGSIKEVIMYNCTGICRYLHLLTCINAVEIQPKTK